MEPSDEERRQVSEWIERQGFKCPGCASAEAFSLGGTVTLPNMSASLYSGAPQMTAFVTLKCKRCALVSFLSPEVIGLPTL
jgi:hypothetical protein